MEENREKTRQLEDLTGQLEDQRRELEDQIGELEVSGLLYYVISWCHCVLYTCR